MTFMVDVRSNKKFAHVQAQPSKRDVSVVSTSKASSFEVDFLPNNLVCYHKDNLTLAFCTTTNMLVYAAEGKFKISESN